MATPIVFENNLELDRLAIQNRLLRECEEPVYRQVLAGRTGVRLLDIGCNNGSKTVDRFSGPEIARVMGLEYHGALAERAQAQYGGGRFSFYGCDVEAPDFPRRLAALMAAEGIEAFDVMYASFVLMHLKDPAAVLAALRPFLAKGGRLIVEEADDGASRLAPDEARLFQEFVRMLAEDPYSGNRQCGRQMAGWLEAGGYREIVQYPACVRAGGRQLEKKRDIFETFFSYLPQDMALLRQESPENGRYAACAAWLDRYYDELRQEALSEETTLTLGVKLITCTGA